MFQTSAAILIKKREEDQQ